MSKTYTFPLSEITSWTGSSESSTLDYSTQYTDKLRCGRTSSAHYAVACRPSSSVKSQITPLYNLYGQSASNITSITLTLVSSSSKSYDMTPYGGKLAGSSKSEITSPVELTWAQGSKNGVFDLTSSGISAQCGWAVGASRNRVTYVTVDSASVTIVTAETDYTLKYNANGGTGAPGNQTGTGIGGYTFVVSSVEPTYQGKVFLGWATSASATTATYHGGDSYRITAATKTLYAVWGAGSNIHYKTGGVLYDGKVYSKQGGVLYEGQVWYKSNGTMYKGQ